ncbi:MAG: amidohydrolase family protein, partial [Spirochaetota bacterium]
LTCYEVSDRDGKEVCRQAIEENINFIEKHNNNKDSKVKGMFGLHAAFTIENETFEEIMSRNVKSGFHIHVSEAVDDSIINVNKYNLSAVERLHKYGITGENSLFIHCNHHSEKDIEIIKNTKTNLVHNPQSNMKNGVGTANIIRYLDEGIRVGLGTDGMSSGMFDAVNFASLIHKHDRRDSNVGFMESYKLIMENNPAIASKLLGYDIGKIKENYKADLIILDYIPATPINDDNFWGHFLFGVIPSARVETNIVDGKILMENYKLINIDEEQISKEARKLASKIWEKI